MKRFKTRQEFNHGVGPFHWVNAMDVYFGVPWVDGSGQHNPHNLTNTKWHIDIANLTDEPHPYEGKDFLITFEEGTDTDLLQRKCFALGYHWSYTGTRKLDSDVTYIRIEGTSLTDGDEGCLESFHSDKPKLTIQQFMDGDRLRSDPDPPRKRRKVKAEVKFEVKGQDLVSSPKFRYNENDYVTFSIDEEKIQYEILSKGDEYFCDHDWDNNSKIFRKMKDAGIIRGVDTFMNNVLGYCSGGDWPFANSLEDLNKVIHAIQKLLDEYNHKSISFKSSKTKNDGRIIKVQSVTPSITGGERREGCSISGRASRTAVAVGHLSHQTVTG